MAKSRVSDLQLILFSKRCLGGCNFLKPGRKCFVESIVFLSRYSTRNSAVMNMHVAPAPAPHPGPSHDELQPTLLDRVTKSGRRLWYKLTVIQQPERARACGSGPKCKSLSAAYGLKFRSLTRVQLLPIVGLLTRLRLLSFAFSKATLGQRQSRRT